MSSATMATQDHTQDKGYEFITIQKGGRALVDSNYGFEYTYVKESKKKITFVSKNCSKMGCPAFTHISKTDMSPV